MQKWKISLLAAVLAANCLAQTAADLVAPPVTRIADKLKCSCGCNLTMACFMPPSGQCGTCKIAKEKIIALQAQGKSDQRRSMDQFVQDNGKDVLAITPGVVGFVTPYAALALGLGIVAFCDPPYSSGPRTASGPPNDPATIELIEKDLAKLD